MLPDPAARYEARWNPNASAYAVYDRRQERWADVSPTSSQRTAETVAESLNLLERVARLKAADSSPSATDTDSDQQPPDGLRSDG